MQRDAAAPPPAPADDAALAVRAAARSGAALRRTQSFTWASGLVGSTGSIWVVSADQFQ